MIKSYTVPIYYTKKHNNTKDRIIFITSYNIIEPDNTNRTNTHKKCLYCSKSNLIFNKVCLNCDMKL